MGEGTGCDGTVEDGAWWRDVVEEGRPSGNVVECGGATEGKWKRPR